MKNVFISKVYQNKITLSGDFVFITYLLSLELLRDVISYDQQFPS
jgi:hypothetical protein